ncbi:hypothetical protein [Sphingomonas sp. URHD0057]|uniref:hypothetical protein n=1 Tax=Sphingomonas sp. URHD0057 TaxID=1380389 RepID=UPI00068527C5|nr:hypothetical protein [Sphingomonas sp. URHD0057]
MLGLVLALRLLTPTGFMPSFEDGRIAVVPCDGVVIAPPPPMKMAHHGHQGEHQHGKAGHQPCPYAAGAAPVLLPVDSFARLEMPLISGTVAEAFATQFRIRARPDRPPSTGPPAAA